MATPIPDNRAEFSLEEIVQITGGKCSSDAAIAAQGVTTDSRQDVAGKVFVALRGESFDGHRFAEAVVDAGAALVICEKKMKLGAPSVVVPSTLDALNQLAGAHRRRWKGRLVAVAGSAGKTSTRRTIHHLLDVLRPGRVHGSVGNLNNRVGVPMVLFGLRREHDVAVVEVGTNQRGEVAALAEVAAPDLGVLTLIDLEHTEGIGDLQAIEDEEGDLLASLSPNAACVVNGDDWRVVRQLERCNASTQLRYGFGERNDIRAEDWRGHGATGASFSVMERGDPWGEIETKLLGRAGALSVLAAMGVAKALNGELPHRDVAARVFGDPQLREPRRMTPIHLRGDVLLVDDSYNANPRSMQEALLTVARLAGERRGRLVLVLGEMRELGSFSRPQHEALGRAVALMGAHRLLGLSGDASCMVEAARREGMNAKFFEDAAEAIEPLAQELSPGDVVLVKASRGVAAERIVDALVATRGGAR